MSRVPNVPKIFGFFFCENLCRRMYFHPGSSKLTLVFSEPEILWGNRDWPRFRPVFLYFYYDSLANEFLWRTLRKGRQITKKFILYSSRNLEFWMNRGTKFNSSRSWEFSQFQMVFIQRAIVVRKLNNFQHSDRPIMTLEGKKLWWDFPSFWVSLPIVKMTQGDALGDFPKARYPLPFIYVLTHVPELRNLIFRNCRKFKM